MSGDLRDPKKSIPLGTISAILVGLIVYIGLAFFFGYRVNADQLVNNPNILLELSLFAPLVVAGIWGATLSSAIGSILGAPRILQATSADRITPKVFARGYGKTNEPRNALILTFVIAEAGILVGELNLIARVVSMFFITTYGFLNLSAALENWASTDFRPSFRIPGWISIVGAAVCFILMLELDFVALIAATIILSGIFLFLKRRELTLESGDTWEGVWSSVLRSGLNRITRIVKQQRNWRPNIILFSGDGSSRPYLLDFGRWLVHKRGILSNFNLIENKNAIHLFPKMPQKTESKNDFQGIFMREMEVNDIYEGMDTITKVYGFAGLEPNSVMLGWARNSKQPEKFGKLVHNYTLLDYNIFILDYDRDHGFGNKKTIDFWWSGGSNNAALALSLLKFIQSSDEWEETQNRIFIVTDASSLNNKIFKNISAVLDEYRIDATIKIINNMIEQKTINEIIKIESADTDLVILGLSDTKKEKASSFIEETDQMIHNLKTVLLIKASSFFKPIFIGIEQQIKPSEQIADIESAHLQELQLPKHEVLATQLENINKQLNQIFEKYYKETLQHIYALNKKLLEDIIQLTDRSFDDLEEAVSISERHRRKKIVNHVQSNYLFNIKRIITKYQSDDLQEQKDLLQSGLENLSKELNTLKDYTPQELIIYYERESSSEKNVSFLKRLFSSNKPVKRKIRLQSMMIYSQKVLERKVIYNHLKNLGINSYQTYSDLQKNFNKMNDALHTFDNAIIKESLTPQMFSDEKTDAKKSLDLIAEKQKNTFQNLHHQLLNENIQVMQSLSRDLEGRENRLLKKKIKIAKKQKSIQDKILSVPDAWYSNSKLLNNFFIEDLNLKSIQNRIEVILERMLSEILLSIETNYADSLTELKEELKKLSIKTDKKLLWPSIPEDLFEPSKIFDPLFSDIQTAIAELPGEIEVMSEESFQKIEQEQFEDVTSVSVSLQRYIEFLAESELIEPLQKNISSVSKELEEINDTAREVIRFINYNISSAEKESFNADTINSIVKSTSERINVQYKKITEIQERLKDNINKHIKSTFEKMNPVLVSRATGELKQSIRSKESKKYLSKVKEYSETVKKFIRNIMVLIVYKRSEGVLFAQKIDQSRFSYQTETGQALDVVKKLTPDTGILQALPFYYSQLFTGKRILSQDFLIDRPFETEQAAQALYLFKQGYHGSLLILGEKLSGKSTLSYSVAEKHFKK